jgi:DNA polymerase phi
MEQLGALIRGGNIPKSDEWIQSILDWLVIHGLFVVKKKSGKGRFPAVCSLTYSVNRYFMYVPQLKSLPSPPFSDDLRQACRARLLGCLGDLNSQITVVRSGEKTTKVPAVATDGELWVSKVLATIQALEHDSKHVSLLNNPDENDVALRIRALDIATRLKLVSGLCMRCVSSRHCHTYSSFLHRLVSMEPIICSQTGKRVKIYRGLQLALKTPLSNLSMYSSILLSAS